jgi:hypothetical protein
MSNDKGTSASRTISYRQFQKIRYYAGTILDDTTKLSDDSAIALDKLCSVINDIQKADWYHCHCGFDKV